MIDYYATLGLVPDAEDVVIKAAYRALSSVYHPDRNINEDTTSRMIAINTAYDVLSNPEKRRLYDIEMRTNKASFSEFDRQEQFKSDDLDTAWNLAKSFYPKISELYEDLRLLSWRLAFNFKIKIIEEKSFQSAEKIALHVKENHLKKYFGSNKELVELAEMLIKAKELDAAMYLNKVVTTLGDNTPITEIRKQILKQFPKSLEISTCYQIYKKAKQNYIKDAERLIHIHNGTLRENFFNSGYKINIDGETYKVSNQYQLCKWVTEYFAKLYA